MQLSLSTKIVEVNSALSGYTAIVESDRQYLTGLSTKIDTLEAEMSHLKDTIAFLKICVSAQTNIREDLEKMHTNMLRTLWDESFEFKYVEILDDNGAVKGLVPTVFENGYPARIVANGGGMRNVLGALNRMAFLLIRPQNSPVIIWDEFGNNMDEEKFAGFFDIVKSIQSKTELQIIAISHANYSFDQEFNVKRVDKVSKVA